METNTEEFREPAEPLWVWSGFAGRFECNRIIVPENANGPRPQPYNRAGRANGHAMPAVPALKSNNSKIDLYREHAADYVARREPAIVNIARCQYLAIDGAGIPGGPEFQACIGALYNVAFTIKMALKAGGRDYGVCKLEGLWPEMKSWSLLIRTPDFVTREHLDAAIGRLIRKG